MLPKKKRERNICSVNNCRSYREAQRWPEPLTFHEFPADLTRRKQWLQVIQSILQLFVYYIIFLDNRQRGLGTWGQSKNMCYAFCT